MQIRNSKLCEASKCCVYSTVKHPACFSTDGVCCGLVRPHVKFGGSGGIMTTAGQELPYPCSSYLTKFIHLQSQSTPS